MARDVQVVVGLVNFFKEKKNNKKNNCIKKKQFHEIIVGPRDRLGKKKISLDRINLLGGKKEFQNKILVKVRSTGKLLEAKVNFIQENKAEVNLELSEDGISPGQACVFYNKDKLGYKVLGGGWITK